MVQGGSLINVHSLCNGMQTVVCWELLTLQARGNHVYIAVQMQL